VGVWKHVPGSLVLRDRRGARRKLHNGIIIIHDFYDQITEDKLDGSCSIHRTRFLVNKPIRHRSLCRPVPSGM
jgi:hypothetical protein